MGDIEWMVYIGLPVMALACRHITPQPRACPTNPDLELVSAVPRVRRACDMPPDNEVRYWVAVHALA
jgi:hypothetical protein